MNLKQLILCYGQSLHWLGTVLLIEKNDYIKISTYFSNSNVIWTLKSLRWFTETKTRTKYFTAQEIFLSFALYVNFIREN